MEQIDHAIHIKTIFCDIDGCIFKHHGDITTLSTNPYELLPWVKEAFKQWINKGYTIILTTGRPESFRTITEQQIRNAGLCYHHLIMDLPRGQRVIINDVKPDEINPTAACINLQRNEGMEDVINI